MKTLEEKPLNDKPEKFNNLGDVARFCHLTRQAIYVAVSKGSLKATKEGNHWTVTMKDLEEYRVNKYSRDKRKVNGELVFDLEKGQFSVLHVSKIMSHELKRPYPMQRIYYLIRSGKLPCFKKGCAWIITRDGLSALIESELEAANIFTQRREA